MAQREDPLHEEKDFESGLDYSAFQEDDTTEPVETKPADEPADTAEKPADSTPDQKTEAFTSPIFRQLQEEREFVPSQHTANLPRHTGETSEFDKIVLDRPHPGTGAAAAAGTAAGAATAASSKKSKKKERKDRGVLREEAQTSAGGFAKFLQVLLGIFYPLVLLVGTLRLVASPLLLMISYQRPGFPADEFGFTTADRLTYGSYGLDYLYNSADTRYLGELELNGQPMFRAEEVSHMYDVKVLMVITMLSGLVLLILTVLMIWYLAQNYPGAVRRALFGGVIGLLVVLGAIAAAAIIGWETFFTTFHEIFFSQGNWLFYRDDTLIRLYPNQFWIDAAIGWGGLLLIAIIITLIATWPTRARRERSREAARQLWGLRTEA